MAAEVSFDKRMFIYFVQNMYIYSVVGLFLLNFCLCLYEDQVGLFDWQQRYIGKAKHVYFESNLSRNQRVFLSTESNVLCALNAKTGNIIWRKVFKEEDDKINTLLYFNNVLLTISGSISKIVRMWDTKNGHLKWESSPRKISAVFDSNFKIIDAIMKDYQTLLFEDGSLLVQLDRTVRVISTTDGSEIWQYTITEEFLTFFGVASCNNQILVFGMKMQGNNPFFSIFYLDAETGNYLDKFLFPAPWLFEDARCKVLGIYLICKVPSNTIIYMLHLEDKGHLFNVKILNERFAPYENMHPLNLLSRDFKTDKFYLKFSKERTALFQINNSTKLADHIKFLPSNGFFTLVTLGDKEYIFEITEQTDLASGKKYIKIMGFGGKDLNTPIEHLESNVMFQNEEEYSAPVSGTVYMYSKQSIQKELSYRLLLICEDNSLSLIQNLGNKETKILWVRNEALAEVTSVKFIELPPSTSELQLALLHDEFSVQQNSGIFNMFMNRIKSQVRHLQVFAENAKKKQHDVDVKKDDSLQRDQFNIIKIILLMTKARRLFAVNSMNGKVVWSYYLSQLHHSLEKIKIIEQRSSAHFPLPPKCIMAGHSRSLNKTIVYTFNPLTGNGIQYPVATKPFEHLQFVELPIEDEKSTKVVALISKPKDVHVFPNTPEVIAKVKLHIHSMYVYLINQTTSSFDGYKLKNNDVTFSLYKVWSINIPSNQRILKMGSKHDDEVVNSVGRVLGDHSVLYKYLNPNLIAFMTQQVIGNKGSVFVYIVDAVTGHVVYSAQHRSAEPPLELILSEHWLIYLYFNTKTRRTEMAVVELYEGYEEKNNTAFSSLDPGHPPMVLSQGYLLPMSGVRTLSSTTTQRGITNKNILLGLENGYILSIQKNFFDPRRSYRQTSILQEEGVLPYIPELPVSPQVLINYNKTVERIRAIHTAPAGLESTSLVLAYGLDLYFTRVTPSRMFDVLKEDFDYVFISGVLSLLIFASVLCGKLALMKTLKTTWQ